MQAQSQDYTLQEVIVRIVGDLGIPVAFGVKFRTRFSTGNLTLPFGVRASLAVYGDKLSLKVLEGAVSE